MSSGRSLFRRSAVALAAAGLALATVVAAVHPAELVLSQGQDTEAAQANVAASWPVAYAGGQASTVRTFRTENAAYNSSYRWQVQNYGDTNFQTDSRLREGIYRQSQLVDPSPVDVGIPSSETGDYKSRHGYPERTTAQNLRVDQNVQRCLYVAPNYKPASAAGPCGSQNGTMSSASMYQPGFGFSISEHGAGRGNIYVNAWGLRTSASCTLNSATAGAPEGNVDFSHELSYGLGTDNPYPVYEKSATRNWFEVWNTSMSTSNPPLSSLLYTYDLGNIRVAGKVRPMVRRITHQSPPYALSEIGFYLESYATPLLGSLGMRSKFYFLLSRSECGAKNVVSSSDRLPPSRQPNSPSIPAFSNMDPATEAGFNGFGDSLQSTLTSPLRARKSADGAIAATASGVPEGTTTSSPINDATGVEVTTSAPPESRGGDRDAADANSSPASSTSAGDGGARTSDVIPESGSEATGAAPTTTATSEVPTVPDEPGPTPANAQFCESLKVDVEYVDAFTADECDAAARISAMRALEDYIAEDTQDSRWKGFTSDNPEADGWRWAAIDQRTGQVVYVP